MFQASPRSMNHPYMLLVPLISLSAALLIYLLNLNLPWFLLINSKATILIEPALWEALTILGDGLVASAILLPLHRINPKLAITALTSCIVAALWVHLLKAGFAVPRPPQTVDPEAITIIGPGLRYGSFPSGHTSTLFALLGCMAIWMNSTPLRHLFPILFFLALLAALSRTVVGAHWPLDIMAGMAVGWISAMVVSSLYRTFPIGDTLQIWVGRLLLLCTLYLLLAYDTGYANAKALQHGIALFVLGLACLENLKSTRHISLPSAR
ncbi:MAG: phosphatase PAP2 family protein [Candidatus Thiodiazotropha sp.]